MATGILLRRGVRSSVGAGLRWKSATALNFDGNYSGPVMKTPIPGPKSLELLADLKDIQTCGETQIFMDYNNSRGNYVVDADGNIMMDLFQQISSLALGYNHPAIVQALSKQDALLSLINRPALGLYPPIDFIDRIKNSLLKVAPSGLSRVCTQMCGTCSNENAFKAAFIKYMKKKRTEPVDMESPEYMDALLNKGPGCPNLSIMSFKNGFHGRAIGTLSCSHTKVIHKLDIPALDWPIAPFPQLQYPLESYAQENRNEEECCLQEVEEQFIAARDKECPVAGVVIEPIQAEGGDRHASPHFFREVQALCKKYEASFIVDEVQTGCGATGYMWAHEVWDLPEPPDYVTFAKKMMTGGFYFNQSETYEGFRIFNTWMGDHVRLLTLEAVVKEIEEKKLLTTVQESGCALLSGLKTLENAYPMLIQNSRGAGTFCAVDCHDVGTRNTLVTASKNKGFFIGGSGDFSIRFRPALIFQPSHVDTFLESFEKVLKESFEKVLKENA